MAHLGARYPDLRSSVDVDSAVGLPGDGAAHCVGDTHSQSPSLLTVAQGHQAVSSLPWKERGTTTVYATQQLCQQNNADLLVSSEIAISQSRTPG